MSMPSSPGKVAPVGEASSPGSASLTSDCGSGTGSTPSPAANPKVELSSNDLNQALPPGSTSLSIQKLSADQEELAKVKVEDAYDNEEEEDNKDGEDKEVKTVDTDNHDEDFDYSAGGDDGEPNYVVHGEDSDGSELEYKGTGQVKHDEQIEEDEAAEDDYDGILDRNYLSRSYSQDTIIGEHDNAEDVMNMPPSYAAPSHHSSNLEGILQGSLDITAEDVEIAKRRREQLEAHIVAGRLAHEQGVEDDGLDGETPFPAFRPSISEMQQQAGAIELTPGVVVVDSKKLDQLLGPDTDSVSANESEASAPKRVSFSTAGPPETPFTGTFKYFKSLKDHHAEPKGKEKAIAPPHKTRRNASLPEEIAELAKEVNSPDNSLGKYRDANLAPSDVDTEGNSSDGSSMGTTTDLGSPVMRAKQVLAAENDVPGPGPNVPQTKTKLVTYELSIPSYSGEMMKTHIQANASIEVIADFICERGQELHAPVANIAKAVDAFLKDPESFVVDDAVMGGTNKNKDVGRIQAEKHVFVKVIGMIPVTLFWVVVKPVAWYVDKAYEALVGKLNGLGLGGKKNDA